MILSGVYSYFTILGFLMAAIFVHSIKGLGSSTRSFILTNVQAKNIIKEFLYHADAMENETTNLIQNNLTLFDFTTMKTVDDWTEQSDTVRTVGMSKAVLVLQTTEVFQRAVFFTLLNPQPNGAGFAGFKTDTNLDLSNYQNINVRCRGQGNNNNYKVILNHKGLSSNTNPSYEYFFTAPMSNKEFSNVSMALSEFKPYFRGQEVPDGESLDTSNITMFGLQIYGGVYLPIKQSGVSALEIENIIATS